MLHGQGQPNVRIVSVDQLHWHSVPFCSMEWMYFTVVNIPCRGCPELEETDGVAAATALYEVFQTIVSWEPGKVCFISTYNIRSNF